MKSSTFLGLVLSPFLCLHGAEAPVPGITDYAYFDGNRDRQKVVVIGADFARDATKTNNCQTRTRNGDKASDWHDAIEIVRAEEDQYRFKPADNSEVSV